MFVKMGRKIFQSKRRKKIIINKIASLPFFTKSSRKNIYCVCGLEIGDKTQIDEEVFFDQVEEIVIGKRAVIGCGSKFLSNFVLKDDVTIGSYFTLSENKNNDKATVVEANVTIGNNVFLQGGISVGANCVILGDAVVTKECEANYTYGGVPAVKIAVSQTYAQKESERFQWSIREIASKNNAFIEKTDISILALGSSHGGNSFCPEYISNPSFNWCTSSQDLCYSYKLYDKFRHSLPKLETIVLFFSLFSFGADIQKTSEKVMCGFYKTYCDIDWEFDAEHDVLFQEVSRYCQKKFPLEKFKDNTANGYIRPTFFRFSSISAEARVQSHIKASLRSSEPLKYLEKMIQSCKRNNHRLLIIIAPTQTGYKNLVPKEAFSKLYSITEKHNIELLDLLSTNKFTDCDFGDHDHMNYEGARKFSQFLNEYLQSKKATS